MFYVSNVFEIAYLLKVDEGGVNVVRLRKKFTSTVFSTIPTNFRVWSLDFLNFNFKDHPSGYIGLASISI